MNIEEQNTFRIKIQEEIEKTEDKIAHLEEMTKPISPENAIGRVSRMDAINNKSVAEAALRTAKRKLGRLHTALNKLESPDFGQCVVCKQAIPSGRLVLMPESTRCVRCAER